MDQHKLHTICESGNCPNMGECWGAGTATFMILGNICTRSCGFCAVATGRPLAVDWDEPQRVAEAIHLMKVKHAVITSVDRDEIKDGGSIIWQNTIRAVKALNPDTTLETLIPDFKGEAENIQRIIDISAPKWCPIILKPWNGLPNRFVSRPGTGEACRPCRSSKKAA